MILILTLILMDRNYLIHLTPVTDQSFCCFSPLQVQYGLILGTELFIYDAMPCHAMTWVGGNVGEVLNTNTAMMVSEVFVLSTAITKQTSKQTNRQKEKG